MNKKSILLIGAGLFAAAAAAIPATASADTDDKALAFIVGAAVGHVISDGGVHVRYVHPSHHRHWTHARPVRWDARQRAWHRHWQRDHDRHDHRRHDRRDCDDRHDGRRDRGWDRDHRRGWS